ncbi:MAG: type II toxin-antitoxin system RelE/ParE family toxin [Sumerlaeia bacterium]
MSLPIETTYSGEIDLAEWAIYLDRISPDKAEEFYDSSERMRRNLADHPFFGRPGDHPEAQGLRTFVFEKRLLLYQVRENDILILRILPPHVTVEDALSE